MSSSRSVAKNSIIQIIGKGISTALGVAVIALVTRALLPAGFGQYTKVITFLSFFGIIADLGLTLITAQMISEKGADEERIVSSILSFRIVSALALFSLAPIVGLFTPYAPIVKWGIAIAAVSFVFVSITQTLVGIFQKHLVMHFPMIAENCGRLALFGVTVYAFFSGKNLLWYLGAVVAGNIINFLFVWFFARRYVRIRLAWDRGVIAEMWKRSLPIAISIVFNLVYLKADMLILSFVRPDVDIGLYGAAYRVIDILMMIPVMFMGLVLPIASSSWSGNDVTRVRRVIQKTFDAFMIYSLPILCGGLLVADKVMVLVAGEKFVDAGMPLRILLFAFFSATLSTLFGHFIVALQQQRQVVWVYASDAVLALTAYATLIPVFGIVAAAWATVGSELYAAIILGFVVIKTTKIRFDGAALWRIIVATALMSFVVFALLQLVVSIYWIVLIAIAVYVAILGLLQTHKLYL